jgi:microcystin-dependent protein
MSSPFLAEIRIFCGNFAISGWAMCNGQILPISQNTALFSLLGTTYGGNGTSNFALPNFQGNMPIGQGNGPGLTTRVLGETGGSQNVTVLGTEMPAHTHIAKCADTGGTQTGAAAGVWAKDGAGRGKDIYAPAAAIGHTMSPLALGSAGGSQPHNNMSPYLVLTFLIAMVGIYPSRN